MTLICILYIKIPLIKGLRFLGYYKGANVTDLINRIVQVLRGDLYWFKISAQDVGLMEPVKP